MITIKEQERLFIEIGRELARKVTAYAIGGTSLMLQGIKAATLDVDIVLENEEDREYLMETMRKLAYKDSDYRFVYKETKKGIPKMLLGEKLRFDLFVNEVITSVFSDAMKKRAAETHEFGNLILKAASPTDVAIMKGATDREKDDQDIIFIAQKSLLDWNIMKEAVLEQVALGNKRAVLNLGHKLEKLNNEKKIKLPEEFLDELWQILKRQIEKKRKNKKSKANILVQE